MSRTDQARPALPRPPQPPPPGERRSSAGPGARGSGCSAPEAAAGAGCEQQLTQHRNLWQHGLYNVTEKQLKLNFSKSIFGVKEEEERERRGAGRGGGRRSARVLHSAAKAAHMGGGEIFLYRCSPAIAGRECANVCLKIGLLNRATGQISHLKMYRFRCVRAWGGHRGRCSVCHLCSPVILEGCLLHTRSRTDYLCGTAHLYLSG